MTRWSGLALALLIGAAVSMPAAAQVTSRQLAAFADARGGIGAQTFGPSESQIANSAPFSPVTTSASFSDASGTASFSAFGSAGGALVDSAQGSLTFYASTSASAQPGDGGAIARAISNVVYLFDVAASSRLSLDYTVSVLGESAAAYILLTERSVNNNVVRTLYSQSRVLTPGTLNFDLTPGTYQLRFSNNVGNAVSEAFSGSDRDSISGTMNFAIAAVPELGTWAMMIIGFGLVGGVFRRKRSAVFADPLPISGR